MANGNDIGLVGAFGTAGLLQGLEELLTARRKRELEDIKIRREQEQDLLARQQFEDERGRAAKALELNERAIGAQIAANEALTAQRTTQAETLEQKRARIAAALEGLKGTLDDRTLGLLRLQTEGGLSIPADVLTGGKSPGTRAIPTTQGGRAGTMIVPDEPGQFFPAPPPQPAATPTAPQGRIFMRIDPISGVTRLYRVTPGGIGLVGDLPDEPVPTAQEYRETGALSRVFDGIDRMEALLEEAVPNPIRRGPGKLGQSLTEEGKAFLGLNPAGLTFKDFKQGFFGLTLQQIVEPSGRFTDEDRAVAAAMAPSLGSTREEREIKWREMRRFIETRLDGRIFTPAQRATMPPHILTLIDLRNKDLQRGGGALKPVPEGEDEEITDFRGFVDQIRRPPGGR